MRVVHVIMHSLLSGRLAHRPTTTEDLWPRLQRVAGGDAPASQPLPLNRVAPSDSCSGSEIHKGRGRRRTIPASKVKAIVEATLHSTPPAATHWRCRTMAKAQGVNSATVNRIWDEHASSRTESRISTSRGIGSSSRN